MYTMFYDLTNIIKIVDVKAAPKPNFVEAEERGKVSHNDWD